MKGSGCADFVEHGVRVADSMMFQEDKVWSKHSNDKVDIGESLTRVLRTLCKALPLTKKIRALSIGSSNEPQFRILETACRGGLYLMDIEGNALDIVKERIARQHTTHVSTICADYNNIFPERKNTGSFLNSRLGGKRVNLVTLHHSLYYSDENSWPVLIGNLYNGILASPGAIHAVLMAPSAREPYTTSWLYEHFVGKFFGSANTQDLCKLKKTLEARRSCKSAGIVFKKSRVYFSVDNYEKFMAVVWMILLYPNVHQYTLKQKEEISEFVYRHFWVKRRPLVQIQDNMVIYKGIGFKGLI
ncbi:MAG: class I SAM-dependent methyltransferase [Candidatus Omnitrophica bacterium]|nr:class I SAM-dependent methyltransferase [Candidatus Omnitrophota bacterium]